MRVDDVGDDSDDDDDGTGENFPDPVGPPGLRLVKGVKRALKLVLFSYILKNYQ